MSDEIASFWRPERGARDQQCRYVPQAPLHGPDRALTFGTRPCRLAGSGTKCYIAT